MQKSGVIYHESYANGTDPQYLYYLHNAHGDVTKLLNEKGEIIKDYEYDPFGKEETPESKVFGGKQSTEMWRQEVEKIDNPFRYCGEYMDEETGNYYLRARYYDPSTQRFINEDSYAVASPCAPAEGAGGSDATQREAATVFGRLLREVGKNSLLTTDGGRQERETQHSPLVTRDYFIINISSIYH